jgi:hypothetical protein
MQSELSGWKCIREVSAGGFRKTGGNKFNVFMPPNIAIPQILASELIRDGNRGFFR